jgi:acyl-CoA thioesterase FadM
VARRIAYELVTDTSHFNPLQLQPRALLSISFNALSRWLERYLVSFPKLIGEHHTSLVILGATIDYETPLQFFDTDRLEVDAGLRVLSAGRRAQLSVTFTGATGRAASVRIVLCPVLIDDPASLAATPGAIGDHLLAKLEPDEIEASGPTRTLAEHRVRLESHGRVLGRGTTTFAIARHHCEVADQWAFAEVAGLVGNGREQLVLSRGDGAGTMVEGLARPLVRFEMELRRPFFWCQVGAVDTTAYEHENRAAFVHDLRSPVPGDSRHGVVVEQF